MITQDKKIIIKDISAKVHNTRDEYDKKSFKKPFIFKGYTCELDRIKDVVATNKLLYNLPDYPDEKKERLKFKNSKKISVSQPNINYHTDQKNNENNINKNRLLINTKNINNSNNNLSLCKMNERIKKIDPDVIRKNSILQPEMRFKPRTDLERVFDAVNENSIKEKEKEIVKRQLINIDLFNYKKSDEFVQINSNYFLPVLKKDKMKSIEKQNSKKDINKKIKNLYKNPKIYFEPKRNQNKSWVRNINLNNEANKFLSEFHIKTHFKATEEMAELISTEPSRNTNLLIPNLYKKKIKIKNINTDVFNFEKDYENDLIENDNENNNNDDYDDSFDILNNPIVKNKNKNKNKNENINEKSLEILSKMAFNNTYDFMSRFLNKKINKKNKIKGNENEDDDSVKNIRDRKKIIKMARKVLNECNLISNKSNQTTLKSKRRKTVITKGLSVGNFSEKCELED